MNTTNDMRLVEENTKSADFNGLKGIGNSRFIRNVAIVATGTAGAQVITMMFSPLLSRIYGPEAFGVMGTFMAVVSVLSPLSALSFPIAIVVARSDREAKSIVKLAAYSSLFIAMLLVLIISAGGDSLLHKLGLQEIGSYVYLFPIVVLISAWQQICNQMAIRKKLFKARAQAGVFQTLFVNIGKSSIGLIKPLSAVLIIVTVIGDALQSVLLYIGIRKTPSAEAASLQDEVSIRRVLKKYLDYPVYRSPEILINAASQSLPILMLTAYYGPVAAGFYTLCKKLLSMPSQLIGNSVGDVFYPHISQAAHEGKSLSGIIVKATAVLAGVGILPFLIVVVSGPVLFSFVFGDQWQTAGVYARWLSLWIFCGFLNTPSIKAVPVISAQKFLLAYSLPTLISRASSLAIGYHVFQSDVVTVALYSITGALTNLLLIMIVVHKSRMYDKRCR